MRAQRGPAPFPAHVCAVHFSRPTRTKKSGTDVHLRARFSILFSEAVTHAAPRPAVPVAGTTTMSSSPPSQQPDPFAALEILRQWLALNLPDHRAEDVVVHLVGPLGLPREMKLLFPLPAAGRPPLVMPGAARVDAADMPRKCSGDAAQMQRVCSADAADMQRVCSGDAAEMQNDLLLGVNDCGRDILALLEEVGRRLTGEQVRREFQARQKLHGDSTIAHALAELGPLHRALLSNRRDSYGRGYGLADWQ